MPGITHQLLFDSLVDDFDNGEPLQEILHDTVSDGRGSVTDLIELVRSAVDQGLVEVGKVSEDGGLRTPVDEDYLGEITSWQEGDRADYGLVVRLTCRGKAAWRRGAEPWQLDKVHGRIDEDADLNAVSVCRMRGTGQPTPC